MRLILVEQVSLCNHFLFLTRMTPGLRSNFEALSYAWCTSPASIQYPEVQRNRGAFTPDLRRKTASPSLYLKASAEDWAGFSSVFTASNHSIAYYLEQAETLHEDESVLPPSSWSFMWWNADMCGCFPSRRVS